MFSPASEARFNEITGMRIGTFFDRYEIDAELGRGAMGVVYRARDPKLDRTVAIKTVSLSGLDAEAEQEYRKRFVVEARAAGRLSHPGIVTIFDAREEEAEPYLVMEYVEGQSLQQLVSRENRTLPLSTTLRLVQEIAEALHYAHAQGVVHRDIKPANILVTGDGHPKIADFGIAKLNQAELTLPGQVLGSPAFMAPEQLSEEGVDARSDLFSLGVILYYMLTGHRPFQGNSTTTVCFKLVNHEPLSVSAFESKLPAELDTIVSRAMAKDPALRYQSGMAMAADIQRVRDASGFCDPQVGDWTLRSLKRDAIPRYMGGHKESPPTAPADDDRKLANDVLGGSGRTIAASAISKDLQTRKWLFSWALGGSLLAAALAVAFWSVNRTTTAPSESAINLALQPAITTSVEQSHSDAQPPKPPKLQKKISRPRAKVRVVAANMQLLPAPTPKVVEPVKAKLQIDIEHQFTSAVASVWLDNVLVYTQPLQGDKTRRAVVFQKVVGHQFDSVMVPMGKHQVRVRIQSATESYDQTKTIAEAFIRDEGVLRIICDKKHGDLQLTMQ
jgi:serine/threonine protein kinase